MINSMTQIIHGQQKMPSPILILLSLLCILTGCGTEDTEKYIYEDSIFKFSIEIPSEWTCESMYGADSGEYDLPEAGMEVYIDGDKENRIDVAYMHGKVTWHEAYDTSVIQLENDLKGLLVEERIEKSGEPYILVGVVIKEFYYIYMELPEDVYRVNKDKIDDMIRSFEIVSES